MNLIYNKLSSVMYLIKIYFSMKFLYSKKIFLELLQTSLSLYTMIFIWLSLKSTGYTDGGTLNSLITFSVLSTILSSSLPSDLICRIFEKDVIEGNIAHKLLRPMTPNTIVLAEVIGTMAGAFIVNSMPIIIISLYLKAIHLQTSLYVWIVFIVAIIFGIVIYFLIDFIAGYLCFWFYYGTHIRHLIEALFIAFSGKMIPLFLFPEWFVNISEWTPARLVYNDPISIITGLMPPSEYPSFFIRLFIWVIVLTFITVFLNKSMQKRVFVQGG